eukprot:TRINITY_DN55928_c0_g1_i1.p1 TRINITY_DN55928_c0_g1~~TRINITY_DN55928_c0_g1_i1.p1  ORF type:complete len:307 (+),score=97.85 TRINITY_DN55928_c0_g1_i1:92-922(+)
MPGNSCGSTEPASPQPSPRHASGVAGSAADSLAARHHQYRRPSAPTPPPDGDPLGRAQRRLHAGLAQVPPPAAEAGGATQQALQDRLLSDMAAAHAVPTPARYTGEGLDGLLVRQQCAQLEDDPGALETLNRAAAAVAQLLQRERDEESRRMLTEVRAALGVRRDALLRRGDLPEAVRGWREQAARQRVLEADKRRRYERAQLEGRIAEIAPQMKALFAAAKGLGGATDPAVALQRQRLPPPAAVRAAEVHFRRSRATGGLAAPLSSAGLRDTGAL